MTVPTPSPMPEPVPVPPPVQARQFAHLRQLVVAQTVRVVVFQLALLAFGVSVLVALFAPTDLMQQYLEWLNRHTGVTFDSEVQKFHREDLIMRAFILFAMHGALLLIVAISCVPLLGLLGPRYWKILIVAILLWFCGGWILAALLPIDVQFAYLGFWDRWLGIMSEKNLPAFAHAGWAWRGFEFLTFHGVLTIIGLAVAAAVLVPIGGGIYCLSHMFGKQTQQLPRA